MCNRLIEAVFYWVICMSLNLHAIVRGAINANLEDQVFTLYRSLGMQNLEGMPVNTYQQGEEIKGNFQPEGDSALDHANLAGQNSSIRKLYVYAPNDPKLRPWGLYRALARTGDYLVDANGAWWFVIAVEEDYSATGWECLRVQMQDKDPKLSIKQEEIDDEPN